jgi:hypothetical protein
MPALFTCPHCSVQTVVADDYVGQTGPCVCCGQTVTVTPDETLRRSTILQRRSAMAAREVRLILIVLILLIGGGGIVTWASIELLLPELGRHRDRRLQAQCAANLEKIGAALRAYHQIHGRFPPAVVYNAAGRPMHSWRALLLPYLGERELAASYKLDEPWDGPNNAALINLMPAVFTDPDSNSRVLGETHYLAIRGDGTLFPRQGQVAESEVVDGLDQTVAVAESAECGVTWLEPRDLEVTRMNFRVNSTTGNSIRALHNDGPHVLLADGTVKRLHAEAPPAELRALTTIRGRDSVRWNAIAR